MMKKFILMILMCMSLPAALVANTGNSSDGKFYAGVNLGMSYSHAVSIFNTAFLTFDENENNKKSLSGDTSFAYGVYAGYNIGSNLSLEAGFLMPVTKIKLDDNAQYDQDDDFSDDSICAVADKPCNFSVSYGNIYLLAKLKHELVKDLSVYTKLGVNYVIVGSKFTGVAPDTVSSIKDFVANNGFTLLAGAGLDYTIIDNIQLGLDYTFLSIGASLGAWDKTKTPPTTNSDFIPDRHMFLVSMSYQF